jgi:hypothetical protein
MPFVGRIEMRRRMESRPMDHCSPETQIIRMAVQGAVIARFAVHVLLDDGLLPG